jgi:DNA polymerase-1
MPGMADKRRRLYLIDGYSNIFRAFYAIRHLSNSKGQETNAVYGFVTMLRKLLRDEAPDLIGVALDVSGKTFRDEKYKEYKANRKPMPEDLKLQIPWVRQAIEGLRIPIREEAGFEADDVLGTLAREAVEQGLDVVLVSADKDLMQLVGPHVSMMHTGRDKMYGPDEVEADFGVPPSQVIDVLALQGDASDNVPGVKGIGRKGALDLIRQYGSLEVLLESSAEVQRKSYRTGLEEYREDALLSKDLVTIRTNLPVAFEISDFEHQEPDTDKLRELFRELEFFSLLEELGEAPVAAVDLDLTPAIEVSSVASWLELSAGLLSPLTVSVVGDPVLGFCVEGHETEPLWADFRIEGMREAVVERLGAWAADSAVELVGHDVKESLRICGSVPTMGARLFDTMLVAQLLRPLRGLALGEVVFERFQHQAMAAREVGWDKDQLPMPGSEPLLAFVGERVGMARALAAALRPDLEERIETVYRELEERLIPVILRMEQRGVELDVSFLEAMSTEIATELKELEQTIYEEAGETFNIASPKQLGAILFEKLGYPVLKKTRKTKSYSTGAETLRELADRGFPLPVHLLRFREISKLKSTYIDALPTMVAGDGRLHTRYNQVGAATGRISSSNPNLQNIPIRTELGQQIRKAFRAADGHRLVVADYSQIELRVLAHIAGEEALIEAFRSGQDIHQSTAATVFGISPLLVNSDQRRAAKVINFGIIYGMSAWGLANNLGIAPGEAGEFIDAYFAQYPRVKEYVESTLESAEKDLCVETLYGRVRWLPELASRNHNLRENARRMAINARIQGTAADLQKMAMINVDNRLLQETPEAHLLLTVHDELVLEAPVDCLEAVAAMVREEMEGVAELAVPLIVELGTGETWYDAK